MIKELIALANELDGRGLVKEADALDQIVRAASVEDAASFEAWEEEESQRHMEEMRADDERRLFRKLFPIINLLLSADLESNLYEGTPEEQDAAASFLESASAKDIVALVNVHDLFYGTDTKGLTAEADNLKTFSR